MACLNKATFPCGTGFSFSVSSCGVCPCGTFPQIRASRQSQVFFWTLSLLPEIQERGMQGEDSGASQERGRTLKSSVQRSIQIVALMFEWHKYDHFHASLYALSDRPFMRKLHEKKSNWLNDELKATLQFKHGESLFDCFALLLWIIRFGGIILIAQGLRATYKLKCVWGFDGQINLCTNYQIVLSKKIKKDIMLDSSSQLAVYSCWFAVEAKSKTSFGVSTSCS